MEEASLRIEVGRLLYVSENLFVESGDYRHELILYFLATIAGRPHGAAQRSARCTSGTAPARRPAGCCRRTSPARWQLDLAEGFTRPVLHLVTDERP